MLLLSAKYGFWLLAGYAIIYFWATTFIRKNSGGNMLTIKELDEFEQALKSGRIEADFEFGNEQQRATSLEFCRNLWMGRYSR